MSVMIIKITSPLTFRFDITNERSSSKISERILANKNSENNSHIGKTFIRPLKSYSHFTTDESNLKTIFLSTFRKTVFCLKLSTLF